MNSNAFVRLANQVLHSVQERSHSPPHPRRTRSLRREVIVLSSQSDEDLFDASHNEDDGSDFVNDETTFSSASPRPRRSSRRRTRRDTDTEEISVVTSPRRRAVLEDNSEITQIDELEQSSSSVIVIRSDPEQSDEDDNLVVHRPKKRKVDDIPASEPVLADDGRDDSCLICFDDYTSSGDHRLVSLKCGHFFGEICIKKWIRAERLAGCPQCKQKATLKDIRAHFGKTVQMTDNSELEQSRREVAGLRKENESLQLEISRLNRRIKELQNEKSSLRSDDLEKNSLVGVFKLFPSQRRELSKDDGCRAFDYNGQVLFVGVKVKTGLFASFAFQKILLDLKTGTAYPVHTQRMRVVLVSPFQTTLILTAGDDGIAIVTDLNGSGKKTHQFKLGAQAWSGCWLCENTIAIGLQNGRVLVFDLSLPADQEPKDFTQGDGRLPIINITQFEDPRFLLIGSFRKVSILRYERIEVLLENEKDEFHKINCLSTDVGSKSFAITIPPIGGNPTIHRLYRLIEEDGKIKSLEVSRWVSSSMSMPSIFTGTLFTFAGALCLATWQEDSKRLAVHDWSEKRRDCFISVPAEDKNVTAIRAISISPQEMNVTFLTEKTIFTTKLKHLPV